MNKRDKGPPIVEPPVKHVKSRCKKPFGIEHRFVGKDSFSLDLMEDYREWRVYRRYKTEESRDNAFATLQHKLKVNAKYMSGRWEFRIEPNE